METDNLTRLSKVPAASAWMLTLLSCTLVVATSISGNPVLLVALAVAVPLTMAAAIQVTAVAPLAAEVIRLREALSKSRS